MVGRLAARVCRRSAAGAAAAQLGCHRLLLHRKSKGPLRDVDPAHFIESAVFDESLRGKVKGQHLQGRGDLLGPWSSVSSTTTLHLPSALLEPFAAVSTLKQCLIWFRDSSAQCSMNPRVRLIRRRPEFECRRECSSVQLAPPISSRADASSRGRSLGFVSLRGAVMGTTA